MRSSSLALHQLAIPWKVAASDGRGDSPIDGGNLRVEREWSRMGLVLIPDGLAIRRDLKVKQNAEDKYEKPSEQGQESEDDDRSLVVLLAFGEWIH